MVWHIIHVVVNLFWNAVRLSRMTPDDKTLEILVLRRQQRRGPRTAPREKFILITLLEQLQRISHSQKAYLEQLVMIFQPDTLLRWHRELVKQKWTFDTTPKPSGRPPVDPAIVQLIVRLGNENRWGDNKIQGELKKLGYRVSHETVRKILRQQGIPPLPERQRTSSWRVFLNHYKTTLLACDFFTVETIRLQTLYVFFFIEVGTRRVHIAGTTSQPAQTWVTQQARQLLWNLADEEQHFTHLIRDNDGKYSRGFDAVFQSEGIQVVRTPFRAPRANAYAERWIRSVREECLDQLLILNQAHLVYVLHEYEHYFNRA